MVKGNNKILFNSVVLYSSMVIKITLSFFSTKLLLSVLGVEDYGIYNVIAGFITILSFLSTSMSRTTQRFLSYSIGSGKLNESKLIFSNSLILHIVITVFVFVLFETVGLYFLNNKLVIPLSRLETANYLYQVVIVSSLLSVVIAPYLGLANSYENMFFISVLDTSSVFLKFLLIYYMSIMAFEVDKLMFYGLVLMLISIVIFLVIIYYCRGKFKETRGWVFKYYSYSKIIEMFSYSLWNLFDVLTYLVRTQGINVVLNLFFGVLINSAYGMASQVSMQLYSLTQGFTKSINPLLVKSEASGNRLKMLSLSMVTSKISFFIFTIVTLPIFIEMPYLFQKWLGIVPDYTVLFCRLLIVILIIQLPTLGIISAIDAIVKIKIHQFVTGIIKIMVLPIGYFLFFKGYDNYTILIVAIIAEIITVLFRVFYFKKIVNCSISKYLYETLFKICIPFCLVVLLFFMITYSFNIPPLFRLIIIVFLVVVPYPILIYFLGLNNYEKEYISLKFFKKSEI